MQNPQTDLALAANGAHARSDGEYAREPGCTDKAIDGVIATPEEFLNRWHSSVEQPHPHWIEVQLAKASRISTIVIHFADPAGYPTSFTGFVRINGQEREVIHVPDNKESQVYHAKIQPVVTDLFRLVIRNSANPRYPNAAQVSEIEIYP